MRGNRLTGVVVITAMLTLPAIALAVSVARPKAGGWRVDSGGGFTVNSARTAVSGFHTSGTNCGLGKLRVLGSQKLRLTTAAGVSNWIVGFGDPKRTSRYDISGIVPQRVKIKAGNKTISGRLDLIFAVDGAALQNDGNLVLNNGACDISFTTKR